MRGPRYSYRSTGKEGTRALLKKLPHPRNQMMCSISGLPRADRWDVFKRIVSFAKSKGTDPEDIAVVVPNLSRKRNKSLYVKYGADADDIGTLVNKTYVLVDRAERLNYQQHDRLMAIPAQVVLSFSSMEHAVPIEHRLGIRKCIRCSPKK